MSCDNQAACNESTLTLQKCNLGHIGPICQLCDAKGVEGSGNFFRSLSQECKKCSTDSSVIWYYPFLGVIIVLSIQV